MCVGGVGVCFSVCVRALSQIRVSASVESYRAKVHRFVQLVLGVLRIADGLYKPQNTRDRQRSRCSPRLNSWIEVKPAEDGGSVWLTLIATAVIDFDDSSDDACLTRRGEAFSFQVSCELQQLTSLQEDSGIVREKKTVRFSRVLHDKQVYEVREFHSEAHIG